MGKRQLWRAAPKKDKQKPAGKFQPVLIVISTIRMRWPITISLAAVFTVIVVNAANRPSLPLFPLFLLLFYTAIALSYYSLYMNEKANLELDKTLQGERTLVAKKTRHLRDRFSGANYFPHILSLYVFLLPLCYSGSTNQVVIWVCFSALFVIVNVSIMGYTQYIHFLRFVHSIASEKKPITKYDEDNPNGTPWLVSIAKNNQKYSVMFFVVGMCYIVLFFIYSQSGLFPQKSCAGSILVIQAAWMILVFGIVVVFPITSIIAVYDIKRIANRLKEQELSKLKNRREHLNDEAHKATFTSIIVVLSNTPEYPIKILLSSLFSGAIEAINVAAALISIVPVYQSVSALF